MTKPLLPKKRYAAVLFDLFGTLVPNPTHSERRTRWRMLANDLGCDGDQFVQVCNYTVEERLRGAFGDTANSLRRLGAMAGASANATAIDLASGRLLDWTTRDIVVDESTLSVLDLLRGDGWLLGLVTDCEVQVPAVWPTSALRTRLDAVTFSCLTGRRKPAAEQYLHCSQQMGVRIEECVFVGDGGGDELNGAWAVGAEAIHICQAGLNPTVSAGMWPGQCIDGMPTLQRLLAGLRGSS